jgi:hypothetical protein
LYNPCHSRSCIVDIHEVADAISQYSPPERERERQREAEREKESERDRGT